MNTFGNSNGNARPAPQVDPSFLDEPVTSVMRSPQRGPWGKSGWRGNTSGYPVLRLLNKFKPSLFCDPAEGGGTSRDCVDYYNGLGNNVEYVGLDLHQTPPFNLLRDPLLERLPREADWVFLHPPYHDMVKYSGEMYAGAHDDDLSRCASYEEFLEKLNAALFNVYESVRRGGRYTVLIGDLRRNGTYYAIQADILKMAPGRLEGIGIKEQYNCVSNARSYSGDFIPIMHEYLLHFKRDSLVFGMLDASLDISRRLKTLSDANWRALIHHALERIDREVVTNDDVYSFIERTAEDKTRTRPNWKARVRAVLQEEARSVGRGRWMRKPERMAA